MNYDHEFMFMRTVQSALLTAQPIEERRVKKSFKIFKKIRHEKLDTKTVLHTTANILRGNDNTGL